MNDNVTQRETGTLLSPQLLGRLERYTIAARRVRLGISKGERLSKRKGGTTEFADYRDYVQGDDLRHVDWNIFGRLNTLYLKLFQDQEDLTLRLMLDASQSMGFGTPTKWRFAQTLAAALGYIALTSYDRVRVAAANSDIVRLRPYRGRGQAHHLFDQVSSITCGGSTGLTRLTNEVRINPTPGVNVLISDCFDPDGFEAGLRNLCGLSSESYVIHVLAPEEMAPRLTGDLKLIDSETEGTAEVSVTPGLMKRYHREREAFCKAIHDYCVARGIGYFLVTSNTPIETLTLDVLRKGGMVR